MKITIEEINYNSQHFNDLVNLELMLWPDNEYNELFNETKDTKDFYFGAIYNNTLIAFIQLSIRNDYVNGSTTSPVGYVEGLYVIKEYRNKGIARKLIENSYCFLKEKGCNEIASDVETENIVSQKFHEKMGFTETEKVVCYIKRLN